MCGVLLFSKRQLCEVETPLNVRASPNNIFYLDKKIYFEKWIRIFVRYDCPFNPICIELYEIVKWLKESDSDPFS